jgi:hypothetical protein
VNWSAAVTAEVPAPVVTVTSTVPVPAGLMAAISVLETNLTEGAWVAPKSTVAPAVKSLPVIVTGVPPAAGPVAGEMPVTVGTPVTAT